MPTLLIAAAFLLAGCRNVSLQASRVEAGRLRTSFETHQYRYLQSIELENALLNETLAWLNGSAAKQSRPERRSYECRLMDRWARVYFGPREIHAAMRPEEYASPEVQDAQRRLLVHLKQRYFVLHDYQRYAQRACEEEGRNARGRLTANLEEFRRRLTSHPRATDEITPILATLAR